MFFLAFLFPPFYYYIGIYNATFYLLFPKVDDID